MLELLFELFVGVLILGVNNHLLTKDCLLGNLLEVALGVVEVDSFGVLGCRVNINNELLFEIKSFVGVVTQVGNKLHAHRLAGSELHGPTELVFLVEDALVVENFAAVRVGNYDNKVVSAHEWELVGVDVSAPFPTWQVGKLDSQFNCQKIAREHFRIL